MDKRSLDSITKKAPYLAKSNAKVLSGVTLTAKYILDVLERTNPEMPERARGIAVLVSKWNGRCISEENARQIIRALMAGGLPIKSARSRGYWMEH